MILCKCGCGQPTTFNNKTKQFNIFINHHQLKGTESPFFGTVQSEDSKQQNSQWHLGKSKSDKTKAKIAIHMIGNIRGTANKGRIVSNETKMKISGPNHYSWKGGRILARAKSNAKRRRGLKFITLNDCRGDGWVGHHIDKDYVIFIPEELHKSIWHAQKYPETMDKINDAVYNWFVGYYLKGVL